MALNFPKVLYFMFAPLPLLVLFSISADPGNYSPPETKFWLILCFKFKIYRVQAVKTSSTDGGDFFHCDVSISHREQCHLKELWPEKKA